MRIFALAVALLTAAPAAQAVARDKALPVTAAEQALLDQAVARGSLLYAYDQAAWHGTDEMLAKLRDPASKVGGWIVDGPADAPELVFFDKDVAEPHAVFLVSFRSGKIASSREPNPQERQLSLERRRLVAARQAALTALVEKKVPACSPAPFNSVVLPPAGPGGLTLVYFLTPQTEANLIPFGRHYRVSVSPDGKVGEIRPFTNSCISLSASAPAGSRSVALMITHLLDPVPTEIHVFSSLAAHVAVGVGTKDGRVWWVTGASIGAVDPAKP